MTTPPPSSPMPPHRPESTTVFPVTLHKRDGRDTGVGGGARLLVRPSGHGYVEVDLRHEHSDFPFVVGDLVLEPEVAEDLADALRNRARIARQQRGEPG